MFANKIIEWGKQLVNGRSGEDVLSEMKEFKTVKDEPLTLSSLSTTISHVRKIVIDSNPYVNIDSLLRFPEAAEFVSANVREKLRIQNAHFNLRATQWCDEAETALANIKCLPENMDGFRLSRGESLMLKRRAEEARLKKNALLIVIPDAARILELAEEMLQVPNDSSYATLVAPLLLVSGRRMTKILNGRSTFLPSSKSRTHAVFNGALKKRGNGQPFVIPLLVPYDTFMVGFNVLRKKQGDVSSLSNKEIKSRYDGSLNRDLGKAMPFLPMCNVHQLRSIYVAIVYEAYNCQSKYSLAKTAMLVCGHENLEESLCYNSVHLHPGGIDGMRGSLGELVVGDGEGEE